MIITLLLLTLSGCSSTKTRTEYLTIPERYLECYTLEISSISDKAYENAEQGDYKLLALELVEDRLSIDDSHEVCVNNASDARAFQESMTNE